MKRLTIIIAAILLFNSNSNGQLTKGNWLVGGNASFSSLNNSSAATASFKQTKINISPDIGYFIDDKLAVGLKPSIAVSKTKIVNSSSVTDLKIGPFLRYYLLTTDRVFNILTEASYSYGTQKVSGQNETSKLSTYAFSAGPVLYFNSSVGLEFLVSYSSTNVAQFKGNNNEISVGIGFQIHLEKD